MAPHPDQGPDIRSAVRRLDAAVEHELRRRLDRFGITPAMGRALLALKAMEAGSCTQRALADSVGVAPPTMAAALTVLEKRGLISIANDDSDRRRNRVRLTQTGHEAASTMEGVEVEVLAACLSEVKADDLKAALTTLQRMLDNLDS